MSSSSQDSALDCSELFIKENGEPMEFSMRICYEKATIERILRECGGQMVCGKSGPHNIRLFPREERGYGKVGDFFSTQYIYDCVKECRLLPIGRYRLNERSKYDENIDPMDILLGKRSWDECNRTEEKTDNEVSEFSDDDDAGTSISPQKAKKAKNRSTYSFKERKAILDYIIKYKRYDEVKGRVLWEEMCKAKVCPGRTWQSLKQHYRTYIIGNLPQFKLPEKIARRIYAPYCSRTQGEGRPYSEEQISSEDEKPRGERSTKTRDGGKISKSVETGQGTSKEQKKEEGNDRLIVNEERENSLIRETSQSSNVEQRVEAGSRSKKDKNELEKGVRNSSNQEECVETADDEGECENQPETVNKIEQRKTRKESLRFEDNQGHSIERHAGALDHKGQEGNRPKFGNGIAQKERGRERANINKTAPNTSKQQFAKTTEDKEQGEDIVMAVDENKQGESRPIHNGQEVFAAGQESGVIRHPTVGERKPLQKGVEKSEDPMEGVHASGAKTWKAIESETQGFDCRRYEEEIAHSSEAGGMSTSEKAETEDWKLSLLIEEMEKLEEEEVKDTRIDDKVSSDTCVNLQDTERDLFEDPKSQNTEAVSNCSAVQKDDRTSANKLFSDPASSPAEPQNFPSTNFISSVLTQNKSSDFSSTDEKDSRSKRKRLPSIPRMLKEPRVRPCTSTEESSQRIDESSSESEVALQRSVPALNRKHLTKQMECQKYQKVPLYALENNSLPQEGPRGDSRSRSESLEGDSETSTDSFRDPALGRDTHTGRYDRSYHPHKGITGGAPRNFSNSSQRQLSVKRQMYAPEDDVEILLYIAKRKAYHRVGGRELWQEMQESEILPDRSWHSLKERFRKRIFPKLSKYLQYGLTEENLKPFRLHCSIKIEEPEGNETRWRPYTPTEDSLIVKFISKNRRYSEVGGKAMWVSMSNVVQGLKDRTWLSLKERYRRHIVYHLQDFDLTDDEIENFKEDKSVTRHKINFRRPPVIKPKGNSVVMGRPKCGKWKKKRRCTDDESDTDYETQRMSSKGIRWKTLGKNKLHKSNYTKGKNTKMTESSCMEYDESPHRPSTSGYVKPVRGSLNDKEIIDRNERSLENRRYTDESDESDTGIKSQGFAHKKGFSSEGKRKPAAHCKSDKLCKAKHEIRKSTKMTEISNKDSDDGLYRPSSTGYVQQRIGGSKNDVEKNERMKTLQKNRLEVLQNTYSKRRLFNHNEVVELTPKPPFSRHTFGNGLYWKSIKRKEINSDFQKEKLEKKRLRREACISSVEKNSGEDFDVTKKGQNSEIECEVVKEGQNKGTECEVVKEGQNKGTECEVVKEGQNSGTECEVVKDGQNSGTQCEVVKEGQNSRRECEVVKEGQNSRRECEVVKEGQNSQRECEAVKEGQNSRRECEVDKEGQNSQRKCEVFKEGQNSQRECEVLKEGQNSQRECEVFKEGQNSHRECEVVKEGQNSRRECSESKEDRSISNMQEMHIVESDRVEEESLSEDVDIVVDSGVDSCESKKTTRSGLPSPKSKTLKSDGENHGSTTKVSVASDRDERECSPSHLKSVAVKSSRNVTLHRSRSSSGSFVDVVNVSEKDKRRRLANVLVNKASRLLTARDEESTRQIITRYSGQSSRYVTRNKIRKRIVHRK